MCVVSLLIPQFITQSLAQTAAARAGYQATALGIVAALLFLNHLSIWLKG